MSDFLKLTGYSPAETTSRINYPLPAIQTTPAYTGGDKLTFGPNNGSGEIISNYGDGGASAGAYKGLSTNPNDTVGAKFDTAKLGLGFPGY